MASLRDLRDRIASVKATQKITKAMQMVAAAKMRRAQEAVTSARPYSQRMAAILANISSHVVADDAPRLMVGTGRNNVHLVVVCTSERGLCGGFNSQIARSARDFIRSRLSEGKTIMILTVGKKGADILRRDFDRLMIDHVDLSESRQISFANADMIAGRIITRFNADEFDVCTLFYSEFMSVISQQPTALQLVPLSTHIDADETVKIDVGAVYEYEPDAAFILGELIPRNISVQIFRALLENIIGEMGAKMSAMDNATRNAEEMISRLSITYNRQRQAQITTELIEIIAGAESL